MIIAVVIFVLLLFALLANFGAWHRALKDRDVGLAEITPLLRTVDCGYLRRMLEPQEEDRLRDCHSKTAFRSVQEARIKFATEYLQRMFHNAEILQQAGYGFVRGQNAELANLAKEIIDAGVYVRIYSFTGLVVLYFWRSLRLHALPFLPVPNVSEIAKLISADILPSYETMKDRAETLARLHDPAHFEAFVQNL